MGGTVVGKQVLVLGSKLVVDSMVVGSIQAVDSKQVEDSRPVLDSKQVCMVVGSKDRGRSSSLST